jgi:hypothetical protein
MPPMSKKLSAAAASVASGKVRAPVRLNLVVAYGVFESE